uniref:Oxidoreductase n=1 Tax=Heterorhabditis bacteriophora TaxID=37862 RepID=A0A1I7X443_HETBA
MLLNHANQYDLYSMKMFSPAELADIGSDVLNDQQRSGTPQTPNTDALKWLLGGNPSQTQKELVE